VSDFVCYANDWVLIADRSIRESAPELAKAGQPLAPNPNLWTDDFSNMWSILR